MTSVRRQVDAAPVVLCSRREHDPGDPSHERPRRCKPAKGAAAFKKASKPRTEMLAFYISEPRGRFLSGFPTPLTPENALLHLGKVFSQLGNNPVRVLYSMKTEQFGQITPVKMKKQTDSALSQAKVYLSPSLHGRVRNATLENSV